MKHNFKHSKIYGSLILYAIILFSCSKDIKPLENVKIKEPLVVELNEHSIFTVDSKITMSIKEIQEKFERGTSPAIKKELIALRRKVGIEKTEGHGIEIFLADLFF
jgi:hypothetical protein